MKMVMSALNKLLLIKAFTHKLGDLGNWFFQTNLVEKNLKEHFIFTYLFN